MKKITTIILSLMTFAGIGQHVCGTSEADQAEMIRFVEQYNEGVRNTPISRMGETVYVPIRFHLVADNDGTGRVRPIQVVRQLERLRIDYSPLNMVPYIYSIEDADNGFNYIDDFRIFELPGTNSTAIQNNKNANAVNIFLTNKADTGSEGRTLGFYSPSGDYVVSLITETNLTSSTLSHELGHFFSLPHTFFGWESEQYDESLHGNPVNIVRHPISNRLIELMDMSNCETSADRICDTPPDYNFGFGASSCNLNKLIRDYNEDTIRTMENNYMGYFLSCNQYFFTDGQADIMIDNYNSSSRTYLRSDFIPDTTAIDSSFAMIFPSEPAQELETYSDLVFDWEDVEGATHYAVQITGSGVKFDYVVTESSVYVEELGQNKYYQIDVVPYNQSRMGPLSGKGDFITGDLVGVIDSEILSDLRVTPNPVNRGNNIYVNFNSNQILDGNCSIMDITGKVIYESNERFNTGNNNLVINAINIESGLYIININTELGSIQKKIIVN